MTTPTGKIGIIGAGVMGQTLAHGILRAKLIPRTKLWAAARSKESAAKAAKEIDLPVHANPSAYAKDLAATEVVIICVKPSGMAQVLKELKDAGLPASALVISIVAGKSIEMIEETLATKNPVIRAMPNTPCTVGQGMTAITGGNHTKASHLKMAQDIFESVGICMTMDEHHFDAITGLSGSGPAYLYLIMEALADGGVRVGLPREAALRIVSQVVLGAATMVAKSGRHPASLRDDVTTPAGCTIGGLLIMEDGKIRSVLARAVEEATQIAGQLGNPNKK